MASTAFITGAASGFGLATAHRLRADGWDVVATDAFPARFAGEIATPEALVAALGGGRGFRLDVRDDAAVRALAAAIGDVDLVVNNAGHAVFATQEEADLEAIRDLFDVNVLGVARVARAFLPGLRARRGTIVQISSVAGRYVFPESGFYAATKHAVEAMSEALALEAGPFGVRVRVIEPGRFATRFGERASAASAAPPADSAYAAARATWGALREAVLEPPQPATLVAEAIVNSLRSPALLLRVPVGPDAERMMHLRDTTRPDAAVAGLAATLGARPAEPTDLG